MKDYQSLFREEVLRRMTQNWNRSRRICLCGCGGEFKRSSKRHFYKTRACWSRHHRMPGQVRILMLKMRD